MITGRKLYGRLGSRGSVRRGLGFFLLGVAVYLPLTGVCQGRPGETLEECRARYGEPDPDQKIVPSGTDEKLVGYVFKKGPYGVVWFFSKGVAVDGIWTRNTPPKLGEEEARALRDEILPGEKWGVARDAGKRVFWDSDHFSATFDPNFAHLQLSKARNPPRPKHPLVSTMRKLEEKLAENPEDTILAIRLAANQVCLEDQKGYERTCRLMLNWAADTKDSTAAERVAKVASIGKLTDAESRAQAYHLAKRSIELVGDNLEYKGWAYLAAGMTAFRAGKHEDANKFLQTLKDAAGKTDRISPTCLVTGECYRAMARSQLAKSPAERANAVTILEMASELMPAHTKNEDRIQINGTNHDDLIIWLAYREARALLSQPGR